MRLTAESATSATSGQLRTTSSASFKEFEVTPGIAPIVICTCGDSTARMSTPGSPGGIQKFSKPSPPQRGSFPLDHEAECQPIMKSYLRCLRSHRGVNEDECRMISKAYLQCRMERGLMAEDEMRNLGYGNAEEVKEAAFREGGGDGGK